MKKMMIILLLCAALLGAYVLREIGASPSEEELAAYEKLAYFKDGQFQNPNGTQTPFDGAQENAYEDKMNMAYLVWPFPGAPKAALPNRPLNKDSFESPEDHAVYWLGHSSALMELDKKRLGVDLVFGNASPVPFTVRRYQDAPLDREDLPPLDFILLTHNHYDHLERKTVQSIKTGHFIVPLGVKAALVGWGINPERITELGWRDSFSQDGFKITAVESIHFSGRGLKDARKTLWVSYVIETPTGKRIFWGGDSGYGPHFADIGRTYGPFDWVALETDAWNGGWPTIHMFPNETIQAASDLQTRKLMPIHWGVYNLGFHEWRKSIERVTEQAAGQPFELVTPLMGQKWLPDVSDTSLWWRNVD